ncbi:hypothetical protein SAMD00019534_089910 [Acytostelium subglobosum LB1]|uniref:hypothetical protein n=1 Tax=Acytostelium subglobosum LB1 TaxID=1410327 RepID=UPI000644A0E6|nr:hypothetical protein SAMD00019534_089910 [Acytostelium subglobosum LB1]GAM25816.1 hypothetical protein SAMD00019534_089910 [Acytostelium subglobosum LB1]|eukprot:XP_012751334.1 hypothetical protein SAMD00019534_089910 [Acytostelium subglobosum LB1]
MSFFKSLTKKTPAAAATNQQPQPQQQPQQQQQQQQQQTKSTASTLTSSSTTSTTSTSKTSTPLTSSSQQQQSLNTSAEQRQQQQQQQYIDTNKDDVIDDTLPSSEYIIEIWGNDWNKKQPKYPKIDFTQLYSGERIVSVSAGAVHVALTTNSGLIYTWGDGQTGRLGHGNEDSLAHPMPIDSLRQYKIKAVCCGGKGTVALTHDGVLLTWGNNDFGQLGRRTDSDHTAHPGRVNPPASAAKLITIDAGANRSAVIDSAGTLYTWGRGDHGRLGHGDTENVLAPKRVDALYGHFITSVSLGGGHTLALTKSGQLFTWGRGESGQLGHGSFQTQQMSPKQVQAMTDQTVTYITAGGYHSIVQCVDGSVYAWGMGDYGCLGIGNSDGGNINLPHKITQLPKDDAIVVLSGGFQHNVALSKTGRVYSWGCGNGGRLGTLNEQHQFSPHQCPIKDYLPLNVTAGEITSYIIGVKRPPNNEAVGVEDTTQAQTQTQTPTQTQTQVDLKQSAHPTSVVDVDVVEVEAKSSASTVLPDTAVATQQRLASGNDHDQWRDTFVHWITNLCDTKHLLSIILTKRTAMAVPTMTIANNSERSGSKDSINLSNIESLSNELDELAKEIKRLSLIPATTTTAINSSNDQSTAVAVPSTSQINQGEQLDRLIDQRNKVLQSMFDELTTSLAYWTEYRAQKNQKLALLSPIIQRLQPQTPQQQEELQHGLTQNLAPEEERRGSITPGSTSSMLEITNQCATLKQTIADGIAMLCATLAADDDVPVDENKLSAHIGKVQQAMSDAIRCAKRYSSIIMYQVAQCESVIGVQTAHKAEVKLHQEQITLGTQMVEERESVRLEHRNCKREIINVSKKIEVLELEEDSTEQSALQSLNQDLTVLKRDEQRLSSKQMELNSAILLLTERYSPELKYKLQQHDKISNKVKDTGLLNNQRKFNHYTIIKTLATHPHSVYLASFDDQQVVLKEFGIGDQLGKQMFERQVALMKLMNHKCIMTIQSVFYDRNAFIQMEYVRGGALNEWLTSSSRTRSTSDSQDGRKPWELQKAFQLIIQGIAYMHSNGIIHRDLKLENVLVREDDTPVISDFDLSKDLSGGGGGSSVTLFAGGTEMYLAPEMKESKSTGSYTTDIWAFGVMLYKAHFPRARDPFLMPGEMSVAIPQHPDQRLTALLGSILQRNPSQRPNAHQIAVHPYFVTSLVEDLLSSRTLIDSREKIAAFRAHISSLTMLSEETNESLVMSVKRSSLIVDVFQFFKKMESIKLFSHLEVDFQGEKGLDHGGLSSEMYSLFFNDSEILYRKSNDVDNSNNNNSGSNNNNETHDVDGGDRSKSIFSNRYKLLARGSTESPFYLPSATQLDMDEPLWAFMKTEQAVYKTLGKVFLKAVIDGKPIPDAFPPSFFKYLLNIDPNLQDLEAYDPQLGQSFKKVLLLENIDQYLSTTFEGLVEGGEEIAVTDLNKEDFIQRNINRILIGSRKYQLESFRSGFMSIDSLNAHFALFSPTELQLLICGNTIVDADVLKRHIKFIGFPATSDTPRHFLDIIDAMTQDELHLFLRFMTGMVVIPMQGLERPLSIIHIPKSEKLPTSHTCSYQLDLPDYSDFDTLKKKLLQMLDWLDSGFGFI